MIDVAVHEKRDIWRAMRRGLALRCPACGQGRIMAGYLRQADACAGCGLRTGLIRADDGPAWATILLVGHLISPLFFVFAQREQTPWLPFLAISALVLALTLAILPRMKGLFIGLIWASRAVEVAAPDNLDDNQGDDLPA